MKRFFLLCLGAMVVQASTLMASAADFTCQVYGGSFVLDDTDFKAMADSTSITRETFASIKPDQRARICATRKLWRLIKDRIADFCDFTLHYTNFNVMYFGDSEIKMVTAAQNKPPTLNKCQ
jgi:hypothetical protein